MAEDSAKYQDGGRHLTDSGLDAILQGDQTEDVPVLHKTERIRDEMLLLVGLNAKTWSHIIETLLSSDCATCRALGEVLRDVYVEHAEPEP